MGESWQRGAVTDAYMRKALEATADELRKESESLKKESGISADERGRLIEHASSLKQLALEMRQAVSSRDGAAISQKLERVKGEEEAIRRSFAESIGEPLP
jgi:hypothetical protein